ncbi:MAG: hypothetical protein AB4368_14230 [Xenococcaceae cyanobacterium]
MLILIAFSPLISPSIWCIFPAARACFTAMAIALDEPTIKANFLALVNPV